MVLNNAFFLETKKKFELSIFSEKQVQQNDYFRIIYTINTIIKFMLNKCFHNSVCLSKNQIPFST